jgi:hypothetical protein
METNQEQLEAKMESNQEGIECVKATYVFTTLQGWLTKFCTEALKKRGTMRISGQLWTDLGISFWP